MDNGTSAAPYGRLFAGLYLAALALLVIGVLATFAVRAAWPLWAVLPSALVLWVQANVLGRSDPALDGGRRASGRLSNYQYAWYQLVLGQEIGRAGRVLRGS